MSNDTQTTGRWLLLLAITVMIVTFLLVLPNAIMHFQPNPGFDGELMTSFEAIEDRSNAALTQSSS